MLSKERQKLKDVDAYTILDYIKTSIEILMNMKMEEQESKQNDSKTKNEKIKKQKRDSVTQQVNNSDPQSVVNQISDSESARSMDEPPKDYEAMLQKYEAEVRNHIKIEQQLKLHIECVQDKLDDSEKAKTKLQKEKTTYEEEVNKDLQRYKDLLSIREKEIESLKQEYKRVLLSNEELKKSIEQLERENRTFIQKGAQSATNQGLLGKDQPLRSVTVIGNKTVYNEKSSSQALLEELSYNQNFENHTTDQRKNSGKQTNYQNIYASVGPQQTSSSAMSQTHYKSQNTSNDINSNNLTSSSDRGQELLRLKKEYHNMVRNEISKLKKEDIFEPNQQPQYVGQQQFTQKSPDRIIATSSNNPISYQQTQSNQNSFLNKSPYINSNKVMTQNQPQGMNEYNNSNKRGFIMEKQVQKENSNSKNGKIFQPVGLANNINQNQGPNHKRAKSQIVNQPGVQVPNQQTQQQPFKGAQNPNHTVIMNAINDDHRKFLSENSIDNSHPHNQSYVHQYQIQQFTDQNSHNFSSHTMDARINSSQIQQIPTSILSGTYINSNIIVHQKHIDASQANFIPQYFYCRARNQPKKQNIKRTSSIHEEKKMIPNESAKHIISASGGHMRTGSYDMNVAVQAMLQQNNHNFIPSQQNISQLPNSNNNTLQIGTHHKKKSIGNASNKNLLAQNYLSAGNTTHITSFNIGNPNNNSILNGGPIQSQHAVSVLDHHSFDNGVIKQQRPQSQMSSYQRKLAQKNSMLAVATQKKKENAMNTAANI